MFGVGRGRDCQAANRAGALRKRHRRRTSGRIFFPAPEAIGRLALAGNPGGRAGHRRGRRTAVAEVLRDKRNPRMADAGRPDCRLCRGRRLNRHCDHSSRRPGLAGADHVPQQPAVGSRPGGLPFDQREQGAFSFAAGSEVSLADRRRHSRSRLGSGTQGGVGRASNAEGRRRRGLEPRQLAPRQSNRRPMGGRARRQSAIFRAAPVTRLCPGARTEAARR